MLGHNLPRDHHALRHLDPAYEVSLLLVIRRGRVAAAVAAVGVDVVVVVVAVVVVVVVAIAWNYIKTRKLLSLIHI